MPLPKTAFSRGRRLQTNRGHSGSPLLSPRQGSARSVRTQFPRYCLIGRGRRVRNKVKDRGVAADHTIGIATVRQQQPNGIEMMLSHGVLQRCVSAPINLINTRPVTNQQLSQGGGPAPCRGNKRHGVFGPVRGRSGRDERRADRIVLVKAAL
jgi:hypothetical protein